MHVLSRRDAIGEHALRLRELLGDMGFRSEIWAAQDATDGEASDYRRFRTRRRRRMWLLYHASTGSPVADWFGTRPEPLIVNYHNITPPHFFEKWNLAVARELELGRRQLARLAYRCHFAIADSKFNETELREVGYRNTAVAPLLIDLPPASSRERPIPGGPTKWLHVGRIAPNKAQHDLVVALATYRRRYDPTAELHLVGFPASLSYRDAIAALAEKLGVAAAVHLPGPVPDDVLDEHYRSAHVFVGASEHEGFYIPALEAMARGLPVVGHAAGAVPETTGGAALLVDKTPERLAAAVARVLQDTELRRDLVQRGYARAGDFDRQKTVSQFRSALRSGIEP